MVSQLGYHHSLSTYILYLNFLIPQKWTLIINFPAFLLLENFPMNEFNNKFCTKPSYMDEISRAWCKNSRKIFVLQLIGSSHKLCRLIITIRISGGRLNMEILIPLFISVSQMTAEWILYITKGPWYPSNLIVDHNKGKNKAFLQK